MHCWNSACRVCRGWRIPLRAMLRLTVRGPLWSNSQYLWECGLPAMAVWQAAWIFAGVHIHCCGNGLWRFRFYSGSLGKAPSNQGLLPLTFGLTRGRTPQQRPRRPTGRPGASCVRISP
ncbi:hypothetical protein EMIT0196MI5_50232 [Pseudomonas sp. IT-196MI5]